MPTTYTLILDETDLFTLGAMFEACAALEKLNEDELILLSKIESLEADTPKE